MRRARLRVLLVEDDQDQAEIIEEILRADRAHAVEVQIEQRLSAALDRLADSAPDLIVLDLHLPDCQGLRALREVRQRADDIPVVVLTATDDDRLDVEAIREGAGEFLRKRDLRPATLLRAVRYALERPPASTALREREQRYARAMAGAEEGVWDWVVGSGALHVCARWHEVMRIGEPADVVDFERWLARVEAEDRAVVRAALEAHVAGRSEHLECEFRIRCDGDELRWVVARGLAVRDAGGVAVRVTGSVRDITRRKRAEAQLLHDALHDALTGLPNRVLFTDRLAHAMRRFERHPQARFAVLYFDLDRFKSINDSLGHGVGDELLVAVARRLESFLRPGDTVARLGGDEFAVLLCDVGDGIQVVTIAERVRELVSEAFVVRSHELLVTASIGIALSAARYRHPEEMVRDADLAMYRAKGTLGASYAIFDAAMHESVLDLHRLELELQRAVERREFTCHFQTIVALESERVLGVEALVRWQHPRTGLVTPDAFIDVAEETGLVVPIGWHVLEDACRQVAAWQREVELDPPLTVSVNLSGKSLLKPELAERIERIVDASGLAPSCLRLEITERAVLGHPDAVLESIDRLRARGIRVVIDDFGTGYASLSYLRRFSYDALKIDRSFVSEVAEPGPGSTTVKAILALADSLDMTVVAEGVETEEQLAALRALRCREAQGFRFSRPMDAESMGRLLRHAAAVA
ncbi:MAG: EAL domain-containing protein [Ectothiorhodospiraceae bacterium]|nr:EAL domain-containing protein [Ectothiorhodospiraceae bacterium]